MKRGLIAAFIFTILLASLVSAATLPAATPPAGMHQAVPTSAARAALIAKPIVTQTPASAAVSAGCSSSEVKLGCTLNDAGHKVFIVGGKNIEITNGEASVTKVVEDNGFLSWIRNFGEDKKSQVRVAVNAVRGQNQGIGQDQTTYLIFKTDTSATILEGGKIMQLQGKSTLREDVQFAGKNTGKNLISVIQNPQLISLALFREILVQRV